MKWNKEWMTYRGLVRMVAHDQTIQRGRVVSAKCDGDYPRMLIACDDGRERWTHPRFVRPIAAWEADERG